MTREEIVKDVKKKLGFTIQEADIKTAIQEHLINAPFFRLNVWELATGVGKTRPALFKIKDKKTLIVISQILHEKNWKDEAKKWNIDLNNVTFVCYNSLKNHVGNFFDLIILDEGHRWTESWSELLSDYANNRVEKRELLLLSGTLAAEVKKMLYGMGLGNPKFYTILTEDAINWGLLPKPSINIISLKLDEHNPNQIFIKGRNKQKKTEDCTYSEWQSKWKFTKGIKRPNLRILCTENQYYGLLTEDIEWAKQVFFKTKDPNMSMRMKMLGNQRKLWLANLKTKHIQSLLSKLNDKRVVVFANDIAQAELFDKDAIHSKNKNGQKIIDEFNAYLRDKVVAVRQMNESLNLVEPEVGIICQLANSKESGNKTVSIQNQQRLGRLLRADFPTLYLFVYYNTQDNVYLDKFIESLDSSYFEYKKLSEI